MEISNELLNPSVDPLLYLCHGPEAFNHWRKKWENLPPLKHQ